ncbi:Predicted outer membrane protein [Pseudonocardia ammonioxydans]|uniref:Predicted outer membrane protein n=1 Tax=Pseudonocardia ammonioxydans TaxID=260086 RepID=A0A1I5D7X9_PSUAM|nr:DUF4142 domain-containing protein [Pseudonocardia ammonioxydans]SFN94941.1 Predicted outer membrane protein [Pseudonocardia ammonioxydans]
MSRRIPGPLRWSILAAIAAVLAVALAQSWATVPTAVAQGWTQTRWGPLGPADRDLLEKVRLAGLWEAPTGEQGEQQASSPAVREIAGKIGAEHHDLDELVRTTSEQLGVPLPSRPSDQQIGWMNDLTARTGTDYDRQFVHILRSAHGSVLPVITDVRVGTRNDLMRRFATEADTYVTRHIGYLESTGLVDYAALPAPPDPAPLRSTSDVVVPALVVGVALLAAGGLLMTLYRRGRPGGGSAILPKLLPATGLIPRPRRPRDDDAGAAARPVLPVGPPDPWDELTRVPPTRPGPDDDVLGTARDRPLGAAATPSDPAPPVDPAPPLDTAPPWDPAPLFGATPTDHLSEPDPDPHGTAEPAPGRRRHPSPPSGARHARTAPRSRHR